MREPERDITRLEHILNAISCIKEYTNGITEAQLKENNFPAFAPKYSIIVSFNKPGLPASGGQMAGSVFHDIVDGW